MADPDAPPTKRPRREGSFACQDNDDTDRQSYRRSPEVSDPSCAHDTVDGIRFQSSENELPDDDEDKETTFPTCPEIEAIINEHDLDGNPCQVLASCSAENKLPAVLQVLRTNPFVYEPTPLDPEDYSLKNVLGFLGSYLGRLEQTTHSIIFPECTTKIYAFDMSDTEIIEWTLQTMMTTEQPFSSYTHIGQLISHYETDSKKFSTITDDWVRFELIRKHKPHLYLSVLLMLSQQVAQITPIVLHRCQRRHKVCEALEYSSEHISRMIDYADAMITGTPAQIKEIGFQVCEHISDWKIQIMQDYEKHKLKCQILERIALTY